MAQTHTQRRKSGYYFRKKVPRRSEDAFRHWRNRPKLEYDKRPRGQRPALRARALLASGVRSRPGRGPSGGPRKKARELGLLEALSALPVQQVAQRPDVKAEIVLRLIDDALISKVCASYLRDIIDADAEVRADCGEHGPIHQFWSGVMEGPTANDWATPPTRR